MVRLTVLCAFEDGVLHEMSEAVLVGQFIASASLHHQHKMGNFALFFLMYQPNSVRKEAPSVHLGFLPQCVAFVVVLL